jgi:phage gp36-like protein
MYCTLDDIKANLPERRIVELTDDLNPSRSGTINEEIVSKAIEESSVLINSIIGGRYSLPFSDTPPVLRSICADLSIHNLYGRRLDLEDNPGMRKKYDNAMKLLQMIADGSVSLGVPPNAESGNFSVRSMVAGGPAQFTMNSMGSL